MTDSSFCRDLDVLCGSLADGLVVRSQGIRSRGSIVSLTSCKLWNAWYVLLNHVHQVAQRINDQIDTILVPHIQRSVIKANHRAIRIIMTAHS